MSDFGDFEEISFGEAPPPPAGNGNGSPPAAAAPPEPALDTDNAVSTTADFVDAIVWGDHSKVWALIGTDGRTEVLDVATKRGMDEGLAARLISDSGSPGETNEFLVDLVNGLRAELAGNDLDHVTFELDGEQSTDARAAVTMFVPLHPLLGGTLPIGTVFLAPEMGVWKVERLIPLTSK